MTHLKLGDQPPAVIPATETTTKEPTAKRSGTGLGTVYVRPGDTVEKSKKRGDWRIRK
ncbi:MAG: hypothetical protein JWQ98_1329 [Chlorobi bacterium]|nr:hypothetical protein [Chlorobiota bacterium]